MLTHLSASELAAGLDLVLDSPKDHGRVEMIVARPSEGERRVLDDGVFNPENGLEGDTWRIRASTRDPHGEVDPDRQVTVINRRFLELIAAGDKQRWPQAGDQLVVDLDLSVENLRPGDRLEAGTAVFRVTAVPHSGCAKFSRRFGVEAVKFANSAEGKRLRLRGMYLKVVRPGTVRVGDAILKA